MNREDSVYSGYYVSKDQLPDRIMDTLICKKCGKIKKINV